MTLAVYDNGDFRIGSGGVQCTVVPPPSNCYSRAVILEVDEGAMLANVAWQNLPGFFSFWGGSIDVLSNGDVEFASSAAPSPLAAQINEVTQTDTPQVVWQMNTTGASAYRAYRIPSLYPGVAWQK